jgi:hypothetical protein
VCHAGHKVVYSRFSRFFCDCGASTDNNRRTTATPHCICLQPRISGDENAPSAPTPVNPAAMPNHTRHTTAPSAPPSTLSDAAADDAEYDEHADGPDPLDVSPAALLLTPAARRLLREVAALVPATQAATLARLLRDRGIGARLARLLRAQVRFFLQALHPPAITSQLAVHAERTAACTGRRLAKST